jgi:hypothetical protein|nr:MAG TPA: collagen alpha 1(VIII) chain protein [Caudoviricetes sp.]
MNAEMYARIGGKALPEDNLNTVKVINFVDKEGQPVAFGQGAQGPAGPAGPAGPVGPAGPAATITKAAHVDPTAGTIADIVNALVNAGLMASA